MMHCRFPNQLVKFHEETTTIWPGRIGQQINGSMDQYPFEIFKLGKDAVETMLRNSVSNNAKTREEIRAIYHTGFLGTRHDYTYENGHPFTVGVRGMP
jgi:hypothetical protein